MVKFIVVGYRRSELTQEQFRRYFRETHGPLAAAIPGVRRYVQNFVQPDDRRHPPWDIVVEFWFDDRQAMEAAGSHQRGAGRLTTTRTVWTSSARGGEWSRRSSSWVAEKPLGNLPAGEPARRRYDGDGVPMGSLPKA
jgi:uncharacterized protein (TIGR02118 family)